MIRVFILFITCFLLYCFKLQYSSTAYIISSCFGDSKDTLVLDTLFIDNIKDRFITKPFSIKPQSEQILFKQIIYNITTDTLELNARAGAGWVAPVFKRIIYPDGCSGISYQFLAKNHEGHVNTSIDIAYKKIGTADGENKHLLVTLRGWIER